MRLLLFFTLCFLSIATFAQPDDFARMTFQSIDSQHSFEQLPLSTDIETHINSVVSRTKITQTFSNPSEHWLEAVYQFPLPDDAAVDMLRMTIGERVIEGEIQEKQQAERTYQQAKQQGQRTSLVKQERANLFTTKLANIGPGEAITISIEFQHLVTVDGTQFSLNIPMGITPRYLPPHTESEGKAHTLSPSYALPKSITDVNQGGQPYRPVYFSISLNPGFDLMELDSPSHELVTQQYGNQYQISLANPAQAEQDFILNWKPQLGQEPTVALFNQRMGDYNYHLLMMVPPTHQFIQKHYQAREVIFVIDSSGSMSGQSMEQAKAGLTYALKQLRQEDSFNIIDFDHNATKLFPDAVAFNSDNLQSAHSFINRLTADGGTEIGKAVQLALDKPNSEKLRQIIFLTDGSIGNEQQVFSLIHNRLGNNRLFTVGIGSAPNSHFMKNAAEFGRGTFTYIADVSEVENKLAQLFNKIRYPVMSNLTLEQGPLANIDLQPKYLPDLYIGEVLYASYRTPINSSFPMQIQGQVDNYQWFYDLPQVVNGHDDGIAKLWARMKIDSLKNDSIYSSRDQQSIKQDILDTALTFKIVSDYTSLVAVDKTPARVLQQLKHIQMANRLPKGWSQSKTHGYPQGGTTASLSLAMGLISLFIIIFYFIRERVSHEDEWV